MNRRRNLEDALAPTGGHAVRGAGALPLLASCRGSTSRSQSLWIMLKIRVLPVPSLLMLICGLGIVVSGTSTEEEPQPSKEEVLDEIE